jgi:hypothetical protein
LPPSPRHLLPREASPQIVGHYGEVMVDTPDVNVVLRGEFFEGELERATKKKEPHPEYAVCFLDPVHMSLRSGLRVRLARIIGISGRIVKAF